MNFETKTFIDRADGKPVFTAELPAGYQVRAEVEIVDNGGSPAIHVSGMAADGTRNETIFFESGESYTDNPQFANPGVRINVRQLGGADAQLTEYASHFVEQQVRPANLFELPPERMRDVMETGEKVLAQNLLAAQQAAQFSQVPISVTCRQKILDGAMGIYPFVKDGKQKMLCSALWRMGMSVEASVGGMFMSMPPQGYTTWSVPLCIHMISDAPISEETMRVFISFVNTLQPTPEFRALDQQVTENALNSGLSQAQVSAQQNQAMIDQMWAQQNAAWARTDAMRESLSRDLDSFRSQQAAASASMDAFRSRLNAGSSYSSNDAAGGESLDDRIQRGRHESMMGVNTYVREDGADYEHTIMNDRVFESNLDNGTHFGTENYRDDYVPDGFHEIFKK